ncbi:MAG: ribonuclease H, partial [Prevotella sp.]|nr:ribonuclease H [Prevotella sp.]
GASHSPGRRLTKFRGVDLKSGRELFCHGIGNCTVNTGEFLGIVHGLKYIMENGYSPKVLYTDSPAAISRLNNMKASSERRDVRVAKAEVFIRVFSFEISRIEVFDWNNSVWGENPAIPVINNPGDGL